MAAEVSGCLNDCSDFGSNLAYANYFFFFFNWVGRQVYIVSKCFSCLKNRKKRWGLAAHIAQAMTEVKAVMLTTWIKIAVYHSGGANGRKTMDFRGSKRAAVCYSMFRLAWKTKNKQTKNSTCKHGRLEEACYCGLFPGPSKCSADQDFSLLWSSHLTCLL